MSGRFLKKSIAAVLILFLAIIMIASCGAPRSSGGADGDAPAQAGSAAADGGGSNAEPSAEAQNTEPATDAAGGDGGDGGDGSGSSGSGGDGGEGSEYGIDGEGVGGSGEGEGDGDEELAEAEPALPAFEPYAVDSTQPDLMIASEAIMAGGEVVDAFSLPEAIDMGCGDGYAELEGILTFRGNNFRDTAAYGRADIRDAAFGDMWSYKTSSYTAPDGARWSGNGWTGQPLIVKWPQETRAIMNMYDWAASQDELTEVVYATMDGYVYFTELETGKATRDKLYLGFPFKGSGALDPRGYPLLYVGAGYQGSGGGPRILVVSLVDGSVLYTFGYADNFAPRNWNAADGSPLVDADTDNLIYPSENGVVYIIKMNSVFDPGSGTMTIAPSDPVKWRFRGNRSQVNSMFWLGIESSPVVWRGHLIITDNGGHIICIDINTLQAVWAQDVLDDTNCTPVLELEDGHPYLYISTSFHGGWRAPMGGTAAVPLWKLDAVTGEVVWRTDYICHTASGVSGGVQGTAAVGKHSLSGLVFFPVAMTPTRDAGILAALDKGTGDIVWEFKSPQYAWSSPVCVYDYDGNGYVIYCTAGGLMYLIDGLTGEMLDSVQLGGIIEASPAVFGNMVVVGTREMKTWGIELR